MIIEKLREFFGLDKKTVRIREATISDEAFIFELLLSGAEEGHFNSGFSDETNHEQLHNLISQAICDQPIDMSEERRNGIGGRVRILMVGKVQAGFVIVVEDEPNSWPQRTEIYALAIAVNYRERGLGSIFVQNILNSVKSRSIYARCLTSSEGMRRILVKQGFALASTTASGKTTHEFSR